MAYIFKLPYGLRKDGESEQLLHISEIQSYESGLKCNCYCPKCGARLQAKLPKTKVDFTARFAHHNADTCDYATETALHLKAKEIIEKEKHMIIPKITAHYMGLSSEVTQERDVSFDRVVLERRVGNVIPDVLAYIGDRPLMIEITITHGIDDIKYEKIEQLGISTLEIDLSDMDTNFEPDFLYNEIIVSVMNKNWVYNTLEVKEEEKLKAKYLETLRIEQDALLKAEAEKKRKQEYIEEKRKGKPERVRQLLDLNYQAKIQQEWKHSFHQNPHWIKAFKGMNLSTSCLPEYINIKIPGDFVLGCDRRVWQAHIFYKYVNHKVKLFKDKTYPISVKRILEDVKKDFKQYLYFDLLYLKDLPQYENVPDLTQVIYDYLKKLESFGFLAEQTSRHIFYTKFDVLDPDSIFEMRYVPTSLPEYTQLEELIKNRNWTECKKLIQELLVKYNQNKQVDYYQVLVYLFDGVVLKSGGEI